MRPRWRSRSSKNDGALLRIGAVIWVERDGQKSHRDRQGRRAPARDRRQGADTDGTAVRQQGVPGNLGARARRLVGRRGGAARVRLSRLGDSGSDMRLSSPSPPSCCTRALARDQPAGRGAERDHGRLGPGCPRRAGSEAACRCARHCSRCNTSVSMPCSAANWRAERRRSAGRRAATGRRSDAGRLLSQRTDVAPCAARQDPQPELYGAYRAGARTPRCRRAAGVDVASLRARPAGCAGLRFRLDARWRRHGDRSGGAVPARSRARSAPVAQRSRP